MVIVILHGEDGGNHDDDYDEDGDGDEDEELDDYGRVSDHSYSPGDDDGDGHDNYGDDGDDNCNQPGGGNFETA